MKAFLRDCGERAFRFAFSMTGNIDEAKDLVQEAFRKALLGWDRLDPTRPVDDWFFSVLRRLSIDAVRRFERRRFISLDSPSNPGDEHSPMVSDRLAADEEGLLERLEREESENWIRSALEALHPDFRAPLLLCDVERMSYAEISKALSCPVGTVRSRISRARRFVRRSVEQQMRPHKRFAGTPGGLR